jgi:hypothetical protein
MITSSHTQPQSLVIGAPAWWAVGCSMRLGRTYPWPPLELHVAAGSRSTSPNWPSSRGSRNPGHMQPRRSVRHRGNDIRRWMRVPAGPLSSRGGTATDFRPRQGENETRRELYHHLLVLPRIFRSFSPISCLKSANHLPDDDGLLRQDPRQPDTRRLADVCVSS